MPGPAGAAAIASKFAAPWAHAQWPGIDFLNDPAWNWLGLISRKPITESIMSPCCRGWV